VVPAGDDAPLDLKVGGFSLRLVKVEEGGGTERRSTFSRLSPILPLPVEFVPGGEGRPEREEAPGLGGSGRSGSSEDVEVEREVGPSPRKIADKGRRLGAKEERDVIEWKR